MHENHDVGNVTNLCEVASKPDEDVVGALREWLKLAKAGRLRAISLIAMAVDEDGDSITLSRDHGFDSYLVHASLLDQEAFRIRLEMDESRRRPPPVDLDENDER